MDIWDTESNAIELYGMAMVDPSEPPGPADLAEALLGRDAIRYVDSRGLRGDAALVREADGWRILLRRRLSPERESFAIAHELAEYMYRNEPDGDIEQACDRLAAAILAPRPAFLGQLALIGHDYARLAEAFCTTQSCIALRIAETTGQPTALVTPRMVRVRGDDWGWPDEPHLWRLTMAPVSGIKPVRLTDAPKRVALRAL